jgi:glycosyltransferase involved in cell wall biosynthesis
MKQLKILHIINDLSSGGAENALINYLNYDNNNINYLFRLSNISKNNIELDQYKIIDLNPNPKKNYGFLTFIKLLKQVRVTQPDIVHAHLFPSFYYASIISLFVKSHYLVSEHSISNSRRKPGFQKIEKLIYSRFHSIISVSDEVKKSLSNWLNSDTQKNHVVIPNGINTDYFLNSKRHDLRSELLFSSEDIIIMVVARLTKEKNLLVAIESIKYLSSIHKLVLVGEGPQADHLNRKIKELSLYNQVKMIGFRSNIKSLLLNADIFLLPSYEEGFGISVLEAVACKRRILLSNIPTFRSLYEEINPTYFEVDSPKDLAYKIKLSLSTKPSDTLYSNFLKKYDITNTVLKINEFYNNELENL